MPGPSQVHVRSIRGQRGAARSVILGSRGAGQDAGGDVLTDTAVQLTYPILPGNGVGVGWLGGVMNQDIAPSRKKAVRKASKAVKELAAC